LGATSHVRVVQVKNSNIVMEDLFEYENARFG
jgi:hypothetical protein